MRRMLQFAEQFSDDEIVVAEYWMALPPKKEFEQKIHAILTETRERMARCNLLLPGNEPAGGNG